MIAELPFYQTTEFIASLAGAFAGAIAAFALSAIWEHVKDTNTRHATIVKAQHVLAMQANDAENLLTSHLEMARKIPKEERANRLSAIQYPFVEVRLDSNELAFLAASGYPEEFREILLSERCFVNLMECMRNYNSLKKKYAEAAIIHDRKGDQVLFELPASAAGLVLELESSCLNLYKCADEAVPRLCNAIGLLARTGKRVIPGREYLSYSPGKAKEEPASVV